MKYFVFLIGILALSAGSLSGFDPGNTVIPKQKKFIRELFYGQRYFEAIAETRRLLFIDNAPENLRDYTFFININYFLGGQYKTVVNDITRKPTQMNYRFSMLLSQSYLKLGVAPLSLKALRDIDYGAIEPSSRYSLLLRRVEAYLYCRRYRELLEEIQGARRFIADDAALSLLYSSAAGYRELPFKSIPAAVVLSAFIPGTGQIYSGKYIHGIMSFIGVLATAGGAWYCYKRNRDLSFTLMFFSGVFYVGNIYGAYSASTTVNEELHRTFINNVKKKFIPSYDPMDEVRENRIFR